MRSWFSPTLVVLGGLAAAPAAAQDGPTLLRQGLQAFAEFDNAVAQPLLRRGLNPAVGPQDSLWALGLQSLGQILFDEGQADLVTVWARFGMRLAPDMRLDSVNVIGDVLAVLTAARAEVVPTANDALAPTQWVWPGGDPSGPGRIEVRLPSLTVPATALVVGRGVITPPFMSLPAGVYRIQVSAQGYRMIEVTREVLPGVTTAIAFDLAPARLLAEGTLTPDRRDEAFSRSAGLLATRFGGPPPTCGAGMVVGRDGLLLTTYRAIRGAGSLEVVLGARRIGEGVRVAAYDVAADLAVLALPVIRGDSAALAAAPAPGAYAWRVARLGCDAPAVSATRIAAGGAGGIALADSLADSPTGTPFVTETGALLGLWDAPGRLIPAARAIAVLAQARDHVATRRTQTLAEVGTAERHLFGSMQVTAGLTGATAHVTPLEPWARWPELDVRSPLPMIFAGPAGRYRLTILVDNQERNTTEFTVRAGVADAMTVDVGRVAAVPPPPAAVGERRGGGFPWIFAALGGVGAGVAALVLMGGGESLPTRGGLTITIPDR